MNSFKKMMAKRKLKRKVNQVQSAVKKSFRNIEKRMSGMRMPIKVSLTR
jgi:hypothetical protein